MHYKQHDTAKASSGGFGEKKTVGEAGGGAESLLVDVLFQALMAGRRTGDVIHQSEERAKLLHLAAEDEAAIASLAVGCCSARTTTSGCVLQFQGLKLLAAVMAVIPESLSNGEEMTRALRVIGSLSLMHPLPEARRLAEQLLSTIGAAA